MIACSTSIPFLPTVVSLLTSLIFLGFPCYFPTQCVVYLCPALFIQLLLNMIVDLCNFFNANVLFKKIISNCAAFGHGFFGFPTNVMIKTFDTENFDHDDGHGTSTNKQKI